ncbi:MAG: PAS domain S-box protein [Thermoleophilaceae bacterium]
MTSRTISHDRDAAAARQAQLQSVRTRGVLGGARAYLVGLGNALAGEPAPSARRFAGLQGTVAGSLGLTDALWVEEVPAGARAAYERRIGRPVTRLARSGGYLPAPRGPSYLAATFVTGAGQGGARPGVDVAFSPALATALRDRASVFSVAASRPGSIAGRQGFFLLQSARFGHGPGSRGFLVVFVPRGWLTLALEADPRRVAITVDGRPLEGSLQKAAAATGGFDALSRHWQIAVDREPLSGLRSTLPWLALIWPVAAAALAYSLLHGLLRRRRAEREVERIFDLSVDMLCVANLEGYFTRVNPAFEQTLGYTSAQLLARPFIDFVHPSDRDSTRAAMDALAQGEDVIQFENRFIRADDSSCWLQWSTRPVPAEGLIYAAARDVTQSRRAEDDLRDSRQALARLADGQAALRRIATLVAREVAPDQVLEAVASEVHRLIGPDTTSLHRFEPGGMWTVVAALGFRGEVRPGFRWDPGESPPGAADVRAGRAVRIEDYGAASGTLRDVIHAEGIAGAVASPIVVTREVWGVIVVAWRDVPLPAETEARLTEFSEIAGLAIANADSRAELAASRARVVAAADETRRRIERDLHDGTQQQLVSLVLGLRATESKVPGDLDGIRADISRTADALTSAVEDLQEMSRGIHPAILARGGLAPALKALARRAGVRVELDVRGDRELPQAVEVASYYVVSEALTNVTKHGRASVAHVELEMTSSTVQLVIRDDGVGGADPTRGSGLIGLSDRVAALGGTIAIASPPGRGTTVTASIPIDGTRSTEAGEAGSTQPLSS